MYGDILGNRPLTITLTIPGTPGSTRQISGTLFGLNQNGANGPALFTTNLAPAPSTATLTGQYLPPLTFLGQTITPVPTYTATVPLGNVLFLPVAPLLENPTTTADVQSIFANPGETAVFNAGSTAVQILRNQYNIFLVYDLVTPGTPGVNLVVQMANPVDGGLVGRTKISTDNNPLPRDRVIFNYDYLDNTPLRADGQNVHRLCFGFEKTFFDGAASIEVRAPFASTINPVAENGVLEGSQVEFGNLHLTFKALLFSNEWAAVSTGVGVSLPTADDTALRVADNDVIRVDNETTLLTPFAALLLTPNDRLFAQAWFQYGFDTKSNPVLAGFGGLQEIGRLTDPELMQWDFQLGYWVVNGEDSMGSLTGLAPFVELHYNKTTTNFDAVTAGPLTVVDSLNDYNELNISAGATARFGDDLHVTAGVTIPIHDGNDRFGDFQVGLRVNWFFGGANRASSSSTSRY